MGGLVRTLGGGLEPGHHRHAPAKHSSQRLLGLAPQVPDVPQHLGVPLRFLGDAFGEGGPFASIQQSRSTVTVTPMREVDLMAVV